MAPYFFWWRMKATLTQDFKISPNGWDCISLVSGQVVDGELARQCVEHGKAEYVQPKPETTKPDRTASKRITRRR